MLGKIDYLAEKRQFSAILDGFDTANAAPVAMEAFSYKKIIIEAITNNFYFNCAASKSLDLTL